MTKLSPLEEALFQSWVRAHGVDNHDDPNNRFDFRGLYKQSNGLIQPGHALRSMASQFNQASEPQDAVEQPDPYMAQAEMHGNMLKAQTDERKDQLKLQLEQMKMEHQSKEKELDRQLKREQAQQQLELKAQMAREQAQQRMQQAQMQAEQRMQQQQASQEANVQGRMLDEHLTRTRPQPEPTGPDAQGEQSAGPDLQSLLMQRAMGAGGA